MKQKRPEVLKTSRVDVCEHTHTHTHTHTPINRLLLAIFIAIIMLPMIGKGQSTCLTALPHVPNVNQKTISPTTSEYWLSFVGDTSSSYFASVRVNDTVNPKPRIEMMYLYSGNCPQLSLIKQDSSNLMVNNIVQGQQYYLKLIFTSTPNTFKLLSTYTMPMATLDCTPTTCDNIVYNPDFLVMDPLANTENDPFSLNHVCAWTSYKNNPNVSSSLGYLDNGYIYMWGNKRHGATNQYGEGVAQIITLQAGTYDVVMAYKRICPEPSTCNDTRSCDHLILDIADVNFIATDNSLLNPLINVIDVQNVSNFDWAMSYSTYTAATTGNYKIIVMPYQTVTGDSVTWVAMDNIHIVPRPIINYTVSNAICSNNTTFSYTSSPLCNQTITSILWTFGDGTSLTTNPSQTSVNHEYTTSGTFIASITVYYNFYGQALQIKQSQQVISQLPISISGNRNTCDTLVNYSLINGLTNQIYQWELIPANSGTIISGNGTPNITVSWNSNNISMDVPATIRVYNTACNDTIEYKVWRCCFKDGNTVIHDKTITANLPEGNIFMNGTITINANINATNCAIRMGQEAKIIVNPPYTFNINATTIVAGCNYMWDGIFVTNPQSSVIATNNSSIEDAYNAIVSDNGGIVNVSNSAFLKNLKGIVVKNYAGSNPISVSNCVFYSTSDLNGIYPINLYQPYSDRKGLTGIEISNMNSVTVGNTNKATKNKFSYLDYGINILNSNVNVYNNNFINLPNTPTGGGCGVNIIGNATTQYNVNIGGYNTRSYIYTNLFNNCLGGIVSNQPVNIKVLCDTFANTFVATMIGSNSHRKIDFAKNRIENSSFGLYITDFINTRLVADSNNLYNVNTGINASNATQQECYGATIRKNTITGTFTTGIILANVKARSNIMVGNNGYEIQIPYIWENTITLNSYNVNSNYIYNGIRIENGDRTSIEDNIISTSPAYAVTNETQGLKLNGIYVLASPKTSLCSNNITKFGMGIRMSGYCAASHLKSNIMNNNYYGVRLDAATIGNQGIAVVKRVNRNSWNIPFVAGRYRVQGSVAAATTWTYDHSGNSTSYTLLSSEHSVTGAFTTSSVNPPVPQGCGYDGIIWVPYGGVGGGGTDAIANGANTSLDVMQNFNTDTEENQYYQAANYYATAQNDNMSISADAVSEINDNPIQTTSIILFDKLNKLIAENSIDEAIELNNSIVPANLIELNQQTANAIYLQSWAKGRYELTIGERETLLQIASQPHTHGGYGVFTAWVMLYRTQQNEVIKPKSIIKPFGIVNNETTIYPNPAREQVTIKGALDIAFAIIYDMQGRELFKTANTSNISEFIINTSKLSKGVYFIKLIRGDLSSEKVEKLIIE